MSFHAPESSLEPAAGLDPDQETDRGTSHLPKDRHVDQLEKEIRILKSQLLQSEKIRSLGQMSAEIAHELNNSLGTLRIYIDSTLQDLESGTFDQDNAKEDLAIAQTIICKMADFLQGIRFMVKAPDKKRLHFQLDELITQTISYFHKRLTSHGIQINQSFLEEPLMVWGNADTLEQVFINLLTNAKDALLLNDKKDKMLNISAKSTDDNSIRITIEDNGPGIAPNHIDKLFDPFFTTKSEKDGIGLGLSIVKRIIDEHGGVISCESEQGAWTRFIVTLPKDARSEERIS
jgi:C4-dicarboxylate-specific signal transduction histidine kinase